MLFCQFSELGIVRFFSKSLHFGTNLRFQLLVVNRVLVVVTGGLLKIIDTLLSFFSFNLLISVVDQNILELGHFGLQIA
jgi:hypothetical protein